MKKLLTISVILNIVFSIIIVDDIFINNIKQVSSVKIKNKKICEKYDTVTATVYNAIESQCDESPLITADCSYIDKEKLNKGELKWVAISRDLFKRYKYGDTIIVICPSSPEIEGEWVIHDTMNKRAKNKIDFLMPDNINLGKWENVVIKKKK